MSNSTNPFDEDNDDWMTSYSSGGNGKPEIRNAPTKSSSVSSTAPSNRRISSANDEEHYFASSCTSSYYHPHYHSNSSNSQHKSPLWMARTVEWPLVNSLPSTMYTKLLRASKLMTNNKKLPFGSSTVNQNISPEDGGVSSVTFTENSTIGAGAVGSDNDNVSSGGYFPGLSGMMGRVFTATGSGTNNSSTGRDEVISEEDDLNIRPRALKSPQHGCVAASNGWVVACMDCNSNHNLRLLSRWNIKAGGRTSSNMASSAEKLIALPYPSLRGNASIAHIFVDPTGNHTLISSKNGEAYYLHSSTPTRITKLNGFGGDHSGMAASEISAISTNSSGANSNNKSQIQLGISTNSYITAVAWDKQMGTEGSTKKILLGTSLGEIYEYWLMSPAMASTTATSSKIKMEEDGSSEVPIPILLVRLFASSESAGGGEGAVTGLYFERVGGASGSLMGSTTSNNTRVGEDIVVLAATSGTHKRTRLHTFRSISSTLNNNSFWHIFSPNQDGNINSFIELPGSIDFADLKVCGDGFAMRTETGIYYGTIDKSDSLGNVVSVASGGVGGTGIVDAGMLPYESIQQQHTGNIIPVSIAITTHHFVTLSDTNEVRFINRVARKVVQKERVDWVAMASAAGSNNNTTKIDDGIFVSGDTGELMMDIRRPDQIWLRKSRTLVHITSSCESRDVWKFTLEKCIDPSTIHRTTTSTAAKLLMHHTRQFSGTTSAMVPPLSKEEKVIDAQFEHAKSLCSNNAQRAVVTAVRAEYHLINGRVELAAKYMAQSPPTLLPFANTATRLALPILGVDDSSMSAHSIKAKEALSESNLGLITFLSDKLRHFKAQNDGVASSMIGSWLAELHSNERERVNQRKDGNINSNKSLLHQFLTANVYNMDAKTILRILSSHDVNASECAGYAAASGEIGTAVNAALCMENKLNGALDALRVLNEAPFEQAEPHYYKHASVIISCAPMAAAKSFISRYSDGLSPTKLLPPFMHYEKRRSEYRKKIQKARSGNDSDTNLLNSKKIASLQIDGSRIFLEDGVEIRIDGEKNAEERNFQTETFVDGSHASIKYLEGVIAQGCQSTAVFNFIISLYSDMEDEAPLFRFLSTHVPAASAALRSTRDISNSSTFYRTKKDAPLDMSYALRVILRTGRHYRSAVKLYMGFGMRQQAVELAIKVDPSLARELARESVGVDEQKKLWLMIARNAAADGESGGGKDVVSKVLSVLNDCGPDILSIEDVLPFMPDVAQIDQFKDEICSALTSYSSKIDGYWKEMNECDQTCDALREEIKHLKDYSVQVKSDAQCAFSKKYVFQESEPFYVFPSGFVVMENSLVKEVIPYLNTEQKTRLKEVRDELKKLKLRTPNSEPVYADSTDSQSKIELQSELDGLIAAECPLTGSLMIESIDRGFLNELKQKDPWT